MTKHTRLNKLTEDKKYSGCLSAGCTFVRYPLTYLLIYYDINFVSFLGIPVK